MFIVCWEDAPPEGREEWIRQLRQVLAGATGSFLVRFSRGADGWRIDLESRPDLGEQAEGVIANSVEGVRFNLRHALSRLGAQLAPDSTADPS